MRHARLKPDYRDTWHHCYNRSVGTRDDRPFDDADKEQFVRILRRVADFYAVRIVAYQVMSNHFHLLLQAPADRPSVEETLRRFERFHRGRRRLEPDSPQCEYWRDRLRDVSWCLRHLQHLYTAWYNRTRPVRRRGPLWAGRFKNTVLDSGEALWNCWTYIERNPVRAGIVADPADYRFCSYGRWSQTGRHPRAGVFAEYFIPALPMPYAGLGLRDLHREFRAHLERRAAAEAPADAAPVGDTTFALSASRRVRHWVDGLAIGSELFVRETLRRVRTEAEVARHRLARASDANPQSPPLCCWRRLRATLD